MTPAGALNRAILVVVPRPPCKARFRALTPRVGPLPEAGVRGPDKKKYVRKT